MGEDAIRDAGRGARVTVADAAERLGITKEAVRKRISRGTLRSDKDTDGTVHVYIPPSGTPSGTASGLSSQAVGRDELVELLRAQLEDLRADRDAWRDQARRSDYMASAALDRTRELEGRLRELEAPSDQQQASSSPPSMLRGSIEEGGKQAARLLVGGIAALVIGVPSAVGSLISYFNDAPTLTILGATTAFFGILTGLVGIYFGIRASSVAAEGAQRIASEANTTAEQAAREVQGEGTQAREPTSGA